MPACGLQVTLIERTGDASQVDVERAPIVCIADGESDPSGSGRLRTRDGVAEDRRVSIEDKEMRNGRKTKSKRFNSFKRQLASDLDTPVAVLPANRPEQEGAPSLVADIESQA